MSTEVFPLLRASVSGIPRKLGGTDGIACKLNITILGRRGLPTDPTYHVRFCGPEGSDDYSAQADEQWLSLRQLKKLDLSTEQIQEAIKEWETRQVPTPPRSPSPLEEITDPELNKHYVCESRPCVGILENARVISVEASYRVVADSPTSP